MLLKKRKDQIVFFLEKLTKNGTMHSTFQLKNLTEISLILIKEKITYKKKKDLEKISETKAVKST